MLTSNAATSFCFSRNMVSIILLATFVVSSMSAADSQEYGQYSVSAKLSEMLLRRSNKYVLPVSEPQLTLHVHVSSALYQIVDLDQRNNLATISAYFDLFWVDDRLKWNPDDFEGVTNTYLPSNQVWAPELYLYHSITGSTGLYFKETMSQVNHQGKIRLFMPFTARALCPINVKHFPFDTQVCRFLFGSWSYKRESVEFTVETADVFLGDFYDNQEWLLVNSTLIKGVANYSTAAANETYSMVIMQLTIHRQSFYYVFNLVIPITLVSVVAAMGFHAPGNSGSQRRETKFRLGIMTLLSMSVMLLMLVDEMPKFALESIPGQRGSFSDVPLLGIFYITLIILMSVCTCTSSIFVHLERYAFKHPEREKIPYCIRWLDDFRLPSRFFRRGTNESNGKPPHQPTNTDGTGNCELDQKRDRQSNKSRVAESDSKLYTISTTANSNHCSVENCATETHQMLPASGITTEAPRELQPSISMQETELHQLFRPRPIRRKTEVGLTASVGAGGKSRGVTGLPNTSTSELEKIAGDVLARLDRLAKLVQANLDLKHDVASSQSIEDHWERVISRLEMMSQIFYLGSIAVSILLFYVPYWWY